MDWSLITGRGGQVKFYFTPMQKKGEGSFSHAAGGGGGGHNKFWGSFYTLA